MSVLVNQAVTALVSKTVATGVVTPPAAGTIPVADGAGKAVWLPAGGGGVTLASAGGGGSQSLVADGIGPVLMVRGLVAAAGTALAVATVGGDVTFTNTSPATSVSLTSDGGAETLVVAPGAGPALHVKGLSAGTGVALTGAPGAVTVTNASPASAVTLTSDGGAETLVVAPGAGPALHVKGLTAGAGISLAGGAGDVTIANTSPATLVSLTSDGGAETLVATGAGPALHVKGLSAGVGISLAGSAGAVTVTNSSPASAVTLTSAGGTETLVGDGTGPALATKGLTAGTGVTLTGGAGAVTVGVSQTAVLLPIAALAEQASPIAPAGQRDPWLMTATPAAGGNLLYDEFLGVAASFDTTNGLSVSSNQGLTWAAPTFDVAPTTPLVAGYNSARICAVGLANSQTYTSTNGTNFTLGAAHPATAANSFNINWFATASLFVTGATNAGQRIMTSPDGSAWTLRTSATEALTIKSNSNICVAVGSVAPFAQWSEDGVTWTPTASTITSCRALEWSADRGEFVCIGVATRIVYVSTDGKTWTASGITVPAAMNNTLRWVTSLGRYYYAAVDTSAGYSLYSSLSPYQQFVGTYLDGAIVAGANNGLEYISSIQRFLIGVANSPYVAYSTASTKLKALSDLIAVRGAPPTVDKFSAYSSVTVNNTGVETTISAPASSLGSYTFQAGQPLGMKWLSRLTFSVTSAGGDTLTIRYYINGVVKHAVAITVPALAANLQIWLECTATVRSATLELNSVLMVSGVVPVLATTGGGAYTRTVQNALQLTAQWGGGASSCTVTDQLLRVAFINGQP